jgi:glycosyltransferase involved in cell wall biosynthesis
MQHPQRILFATTVLPGDERGGGEIVSSRFVGALRKLGCEVLVLGYGRRGYLAGVGERLIETRAIESGSALFSSIIWAICAFFSGRAFSTQKYVSGRYKKILLNELKRNYWDVVVIDHAQMGWLLPYLNGQTLVHLSHNNESALYAERARHSSDIRGAIFRREYRRMRKLERALAVNCGAVWILTRSDADYFSQLGAFSRAFDVPSMNLDLELKSLSASRDVVLLGSWSWAPNRAGLLWFCEQVLPHLCQEINVTVAGQGAEHLRDRFPDVEFLGRVPNASAFLASGRCIAVPSIEGAGIQIKSLDALAIGRPVVATRFALRSIKVPEDRVIIADRAADFASAISDMLKREQPVSLDESWARTRREAFEEKMKQALQDLTDKFSGQMKQ